MIENWHQNLKNKNREELIAAGKELFMKQSFLIVNIKDVCGRAGVSRVTFYKHFQSLDELIFEVQMELLESMAEFVVRTAAGAINGKEKLRSMLDAWMDFAWQHPEYIKFILLFDLHYEAYESNQELKERYERFIHEKKEQHFLIAALEAGKKDGSLKPELEALETAQFIFTSMMGLLQKLSLAPMSQWGLIPKRFAEMLIQHVSAAPASG
ncbi:TetR/AcrR family transcriptional regulator [Paenibacillus macerans]|uniref:TetR/AcrR family transcriptional regulator n=1 Tax=Paenibacillus macerans TaxID=44252 RepID=UPI0020404AB4|nr:TetR/AcrR family transcriptional regulator [Paenibacillus macerans]MCM3699646.1 TetR/AcrR family transcriptional regulator [Paenibacillus macerans]